MALAWTPDDEPEYLRMIYRQGFKKGIIIMTPALQELLLRAAQATHGYWQAVSQVTDALERGDFDDTDKLTQLAADSRELSRQVIELHEREGEV